MTPRDVTGPRTTSVEVRERLVEALRLDLVGPGAGHALAEERLPGWVRPSNWYLTGFLIPTGTPHEKRADADENEDFELVPESAGLTKESNEERKAAKKAYFPSSMGLSFLVAQNARDLRVTVRWGDYAPAEIEGGDGKPVPVWQRRPREASLTVVLIGAAEPREYDVPGSGGLQLHVVERPIAGEHLAGRIPGGTRSVSVFLVNRRPADRDQPNLTYASQEEIEVYGDRPFVARPIRGARSPRTGTRRSPTRTTQIPPGTRWAMASRPSGTSPTEPAEVFAPLGFPAPKWRRRRPWMYRGSNCRCRRLAPSPMVRLSRRRSGRSWRDSVPG
jgi:hypothetical protein